jgi:putative ABC transport system permease protein
VKRVFRLSAIRSDPPRDVGDEIRFHLDMRTREFIEQGMSPADARRAAEDAFGDVHEVEEECTKLRLDRDRQRDRRETVRSIGQDIRFAARTLRKRPGFTLAAVVTLALGIGANTAIFSVINGVLLQPLPYAQGEDLVYLRQPIPPANVPSAGFSPLEVAAYREQTPSLAAIVEYHSMPFILLGTDEPRRVVTGVVSANFFDVVGLRPHLGRTFRPGEDAAGAEPVLVLSYRYWQSAFGGDSTIIGRTFEMNDRVHTVVGVLPPVPQFPNENDVYMPVSSCPFRMAEPTRTNWNARMLTAFARLAPGVRLDQARAELTTVASRLYAEQPAAYARPGGGAPAGFTITATPLKEDLIGEARPTLLILLGTAGFVLLIACANVANLMLAQVTRREREMAVRTALGAGRGRLVRQMITESTLLAVIGGALGVVMARLGLGLLTAFAARFTPRAAEIALDGWVLLFALVVSVLTGIVFGTLPALPIGRNVVGSLKEGAGGSGSRASQRTRRVLVVAQVAVAFTLLIGAGLMLRSVIALQSVNPGFEPERVLTAFIDLNWSKYISGAQVRTFYDRLLDELGRDPGVVAVAASIAVPLDGRGPIPIQFDIEGRAQDPSQPPLQGDYRSVSTGYFAALGIPTVRGRTFTDQDNAETPRAVVISQAAAAKFWPNEDPIGQRIRGRNAQANPPWLTVVGVVGDVRQHGLDEAPTDEIYVAFAQSPARPATIALRTRGEPGAISRRLQDAVRAIDPEQPVVNIRTLTDLRGEALASPRLTMTLLALFAALALVITATGLAGVIAFMVSQRTREIGIRMALGAAQGSVLSMILRQGLSLVIIGLALGVAGAFALTRFMSDLLFGVAPTDPLTFVTVSVVLLGVAALACLVPARRATTIDPLLALRAD